MASSRFSVSIRRPSSQRNQLVVRAKGQQRRLRALLGAAGEKDIGHQFPDSSPEYKNISSLLLLERVGDMIRSDGFIIEYIDSTILAQAPKMSPHLESMKKNIAAALKTDAASINIKATTEEGLGFTGSGEGIAAHAVCLLGKA